MKRLFCAILILALAMTALTGCDRRSTTAPEETQSSDFVPEATAIGSGLTQAVEGQSSQPTTEIPGQPAVQDATIAPENSAAPEVPTATAETAVMPFASATAQPNAMVSSYAEIAAPSLGFKFNHPADWDNIPGRSTVCYVQPMEDGTVYPARVAVTMKKMPHKTGPKTMTEQIGEYMKSIMSQYDEKTFEVGDLNTNDKFMGKLAYSTGYLAYDGDQEIQGYVIMTYFDYYLFVFHFLSAYDDFATFQPAMNTMRDSVQPLTGEIDKN